VTILLRNGNINTTQQQTAFQPGTAWTSGRLMTTRWFNSQSSTALGTTGAIYGHPFVIPGGTTLYKLGINVAVAGAGAQIGVYIYTSSGYGYSPSTLVTSALMSASATGLIQTTLSPQLYVPTTTEYWALVRNETNIACSAFTYNNSNQILLTTNDYTTTSLTWSGGVYIVGYTMPASIGANTSTGGATGTFIVFMQTN
jgi:hypothetical protein